MAIPLCIRDTHQRKIVGVSRLTQGNVETMKREKHSGSISVNLLQYFLLHIQRHPKVTFDKQKCCSGVSVKLFSQSSQRLKTKGHVAAKIKEYS